MPGFTDLKVYQRVRLKKDGRDPQKWCDERMYDVVIWAVHTKTFTAVGFGPGSKTWDLTRLTADDVDCILGTCDS